MSYYSASPLSNAQGTGALSALMRLNVPPLPGACIQSECPEKTTPYSLLTLHSVPLALLYPLVLSTRNCSI